MAQWMDSMASKVHFKASIILNSYEEGSLA